MTLLGGGDCCSDDEDSIQIQRIVVDDLNVDVLNGRDNDDMVNEITVHDSLDFNTADEMVDGLESESEYVLNVGLGDDATEHVGPGDDILDVPEMDSDLNFSGTGVVYGSKKQKGPKIKKSYSKALFRSGSVAGSSIPGAGIGAGDMANNSLVCDSSSSVRKWERKKVQIKTLEGEFSVFVWVTGSWDVPYLICSYMFMVLVYYCCPYSFGTEMLSCVDAYSYLCVTVSSGLRWYTHISNISAKATRILNFVRCNIYDYSPDAKAVAYISLIIPHLDYAAFVWDPSLSWTYLNWRVYNGVLPDLCVTVTNTTSVTDFLDLH